MTRGALQVATLHKKGIDWGLLLTGLPLLILSRAANIFPVAYGVNLGQCLAALAGFTAPQDLIWLLHAVLLFSGLVMLNIMLSVTLFPQKAGPGVPTRIDCASLRWAHTRSKSVSPVQYA